MIPLLHYHDHHVCNNKEIQAEKLSNFPIRFIYFGNSNENELCYIVILLMTSPYQQFAKKQWLFNTKISRK